MATAIVTAQQPIAAWMIATRAEALGLPALALSVRLSTSPSPGWGLLPTAGRSGNARGLFLGPIGVDWRQF